MLLTNVTPVSLMLSKKSEPLETAPVSISGEWIILYSYKGIQYKRAQKTFPGPDGNYSSLYRSPKSVVKISFQCDWCSSVG